MRTWTTAALIVTALAATLPASPTLADEPMRILTYPIGLVVGELTVRVDLGPRGQPADLYLDGGHACAVTVTSPACTVDLGPDPRVHLLELVRAGAETATERVERWVNRPGQEAELSLTVTESGDETCAARIGWAHPLRQDPVELTVTLNGEALETDAVRRSLRFPCTASEGSKVLVASAIFDDGRRVEATAVIGGFSSEAAVDLTAVSLVSDTGAPCAGWPAPGLRGDMPTMAEISADSGFEVVLVLDPEAAYRQILQSGRGANRSGTLKAKRSLWEAERLWYVAPEEGLYRINGFARGRPEWLELLFNFGLKDFQGELRLADAVAASGLVAGAGGRRRAVVLILGHNVHKRDRSSFTPRQARDYLAEVNVPLVVIRSAKARDDGWPQGLFTFDMEAMSRNLRTVSDVLESQCIAWVPSQLSASAVAEGLPAGMRLAGRGGDAPASPAAVWERAEVEIQQEATAEHALVVERIDVTAITVVVSASDADRRPVTDLTVADLEVLEDGAAAEILTLAPLAGPPDAAAASSPEEGPTAADETANDVAELPVAVYVDRSLSGGSDLRQALRAVAGEAERLAALGPLEVVVAEKERVRTLIGPTRDAAAVAATLEQLARDGAGFHSIERIRTNFLQGIRQIPRRGSDLMPGIPSMGISFAARAAAGEEDVLLKRSLERLSFWARREAGHHAGLLVVAGVSFDEDPAPFYLPYVEKMEPDHATRFRAELIRRRQGPAVGDLGSELAGTGWRVLAVAGQAVGSSATGAESRTDKLYTFSSNSPGSVQVQDPEWLLLSPVDTQRHLAHDSGGDAVIGARGLRDALDEARGWYLLTYQVARPPDGESHDLELRPRRTGVEIKTSKVVTAATSEGQAEARVRRLLGGSTQRGELVVGLTLGAATVADERSTAEVEAVVELASLATLLNQNRAGAILRITVAVVEGDREPVVVHRRERLAEVPRGWIYTFPLEWAAASGGRLAVTIEEVTSGLWGGALAELPAAP